MCGDVQGFWRGAVKMENRFHDGGLFVGGGRGGEVHEDGGGGVERVHGGRGRRGEFGDAVGVGG